MVAGPIAVIFEPFLQAGLGLAGRGLCCRDWGWCVRVGRSGFVLSGLRLVLSSG